MFYDINQTMALINDNPSLIFELFKDDYKDVIESIISKDDFNFNLVDESGNNIMMRLLKNKYYDLVLKYIDKDIDYNHQNNDGDTFLHMLVSMNYIYVKDILEVLLNREDIDLNKTNNKNDTILDISINSRYLYTTNKILSNEKFRNIGTYSFINYYNAYIKSNNYGSYSKSYNYSLLISNLSNKEDLLPNLTKLLKVIKKNNKIIEKEFIDSKTNRLDIIIKSYALA